MTDTSADIQARFDALMRQCSGSDRVRMMSEMFDFAKMLVLANLRALDPTATETELRVRLFDRLYGQEVDASQHARVVMRLRESDTPV